MEANRLETILHLFLAGLVAAALMLFVRQTQVGEAVVELPEIVVHAYPTALASRESRPLT